FYKTTTEAPWSQWVYAKGFICSLVENLHIGFGVIDTVLYPCSREYSQLYGRLQRSQRRSKSSRRLHAQCPSHIPHKSTHRFPHLGILTAGTYDKTRACQRS